MKRYLFTIEKEDVGKHVINRPKKVTKLPSHGICLSNVLGRVLPIDIGKRGYMVDGVIQVESNETRDRRLARDR